MSSDWSPPAGLARVISGVGSVRERLAGALRDLGARRPMIVCGRNIAATPLVAMIGQAAGVECALFDGSLEHTPVEAVEAGIVAARATRPDALIALGGSSAIDLAKAIAVAIRLDLATARDLLPISFTRLPTGEAGKLVERLPLICIPTTLSGAEFQAFFGIRDPEDRHKQPYAEQGLVARTVFHDGDIAASTPSALWLQTGAKSLDDCLMRYCMSAGDEPAWDSVQLAAIRGLLDGLTGEGAEARQRDFHHLWLPTCPVPRATPFAYRGWLSIAVRHSLGGMIGLAHGIGSCVAMVEALRFHAPGTAERQAALADVLGGAGTLTAIISDWRQMVGLPASLGELGVDPALAGELAAAVVREVPGLGAEADVRTACERLWQA